MSHDLFSHKLNHISLMPRESSFHEQDPIASFMGQPYPTIYVRARSFTEAIELAEQANPERQVYGINIVNRRDSKVKDIL